MQPHNVHGTNTQMVEHLPIRELRSVRKCTRTHSDRQIDALCAAIKRFGFIGAIYIDEQNGILAGHARVRAATKLGMAQVPCLRVSHLSDEDKRAYQIAENRLAELAEWDKEALALELKDLTDLAFPVQLTGFELPQIDKILHDAAESCAIPASKARDSIPAPQITSVSRLGDHWHLGRHRVVCGDARAEAVVATVMGDAKAASVFADPPYNRAVEDISGLGRIKHRPFACASGEMDSAQFTDFLVQALGPATRACRDGAIAFVCMDWRHMAELSGAGRRLGLTQCNLCVWNKTNAGLGSFYRSQHELIFVWKVGSAPHTNNFGLGEHGRHRTNVWTYPGLNAFKADRMEELAAHPTVKPTALVADALRDVTNRGDVVLDPFGGSGTTLIAAQTTGRIARLVEIDPIYCDVIIRRFERFTGKRATLDATGETFEQVGRGRATAADAARKLEAGWTAAPVAGGWQ